MYVHFCQSKNKCGPVLKVVTQQPVVESKDKSFQTPVTFAYILATEVDRVGFGGKNRDFARRMFMGFIDWLSSVFVMSCLCKRFCLKKTQHSSISSAVAELRLCIGQRKKKRKWRGIKCAYTYIRRSRSKPFLYIYLNLTYLYSVYLSMSVE